jgi:hypothetical protein
LIPLDASRDGVLTIFSRGQGGRRRLLIHSRADGTAKPYLTGDSDTPQASLSYDNKWLAYVSNEYGARQIIVQSFPDPSKWRWQISTNGGVDPRWRRDGSELYYVDGDQRLMAVSVTPGREGLVPGKPSLLFTLPRRSPAQLLGSAYGYDAAADGQRFLVSVPLNAVQKIPLTVTMNWTALLKKK